MSVLQDKTVPVHLVDLCSAMDLIALLTNDGFVCIHRTLSWERVYLKKLSELQQNKDESVTCIKLSLDGKYLCLGCSEGSLLLLDIEHHQIFRKSLSHQSEATLVPTPETTRVEKICWSPAISAEDVSSLSNTMNSPELEELFEQESGNSENPQQLNHYRRCFQQLSQTVLFVFLSNYSMLVLAYGLEVIYEASLLSVFSPSVEQKFLKLIEPAIVAKDLVLRLPPAASDFSSLLPRSMESPRVAILPAIFLHHFSELKRLSYISLMMSLFRKKLEEAVQNLSRKWKDCVKTLPPKIALLQSLLQGYEMKLSPIEFLHSVALCGLWHPAALTCFSQHWNDQGISRLRSSIDSTTKYIIRCLQFKVYPVIMNMILFSKEYVAVCKRLGASCAEEYQSNIMKRSLVWEALSLELIQLLVSYDQTMHEAKYAREAMLSFMMFVKDCFGEATNQANSGNNNPIAASSSSSIDYEIRQKCSYYFEPKSHRAPIQNAEYVTGSHLFAHFTELPSQQPIYDFITDCNQHVFQENQQYSAVDLITFQRYIHEKQSMLQELFADIQTSIVSVSDEGKDRAGRDTLMRFLDHLLHSSAAASSSIHSSGSPPSHSSLEPKEDAALCRAPLCLFQQLKRTSHLYLKEVHSQSIDLFNQNPTSPFGLVSASAASPTHSHSLSRLVGIPTYSNSSVRIIDQQSFLITNCFLLPLQKSALRSSDEMQSDNANDNDNDFSFVEINSALSHLTVSLSEQSEQSNELLLSLQELVLPSKNEEGGVVYLARVSLPSLNRDLTASPLKVLFYDRSQRRAVIERETAAIDLKDLHLVIVNVGREMSVMKFGLSEVSFTVLPQAECNNSTAQWLSSLPLQKIEELAVATSLSVAEDCLEFYCEMNSARGILWLQQVRSYNASRVYVIDVEPEPEDDSSTEVQEDEISAD